jgi:hypothetical protein
MKTLHFEIIINAVPEKVWKSLWDLENYKIWTRPFGEGSYYKAENFLEGAKIHFLMPSGDGMYSILEKVDEPRFIALKHVGEIKNFEEQPLKDQEWSNAMEVYELKSIEEGTKLMVNVDTVEQYVDSMNETFPLALNAVKKLAET